MNLNETKNFETKQVVTKDNFKTIYINESFGWKYQSTIDSIDGSIITFQRESTNTREYLELISNEAQYYNLRPRNITKQREIKTKFKWPLFIFLTILLIIPGIIYLIWYSHKKKNPVVQNYETKESNDEFLRRGNSILWESRRIAFKNQNVMLLDVSNGDYRYEIPNHPQNHPINKQENFEL